VPPWVAEALMREFGKGFDVSGLRYMRLFFQAFPMCDALCRELNWEIKSILVYGMFLAWADQAASFC
jgi:hypothetical protein